MIVGAGAAGIEAAGVAALREHEVTLFERTTEVAPQIKLAATPPTKDKVNWVWDWLKCEVKKLKNAELELGIEVTSDTVKAFEPDALVIATGAKPVIPDIPGVKNPNVVVYQDLLAAQSTVKGMKVVVGCLRWPEVQVPYVGDRRCRRVISCLSNASI